MNDNSNLWLDSLKKSISEESQLQQLTLEISQHASFGSDMHYAKLNAFVYIRAQHNWTSQEPKILTQDKLKILKSKLNQ